MQSSDSLPTSTPPFAKTSDAGSDHSGCVAATRNLLGPFRPIVGGHTIAEAGGSVWLPTYVLLVFRLTCTCALVFTLVLYTATRDFRFHTLGAWIYLGTSCALALATFSSLRYMLYPEVSSSKTGARSFSRLANITVPTYQVFLTAAASIDLVFWLFLKEGNLSVPEKLLHILNVAPIFADSLLAFRMHFRIAYILFAEALVVTGLIFAWIWFAARQTWPYNRLDFREVSGGTAAGLHIALLVTPLLLGILILLLNRLNRLPFLTKRIRNRVAEEELASTASDDEECGALPLQVDVSDHVAALKASHLNITSISAPLPLYHPEGDNVAFPAIKNNTSP